MPGANGQLTNVKETVDGQKKKHKIKARRRTRVAHWLIAQVAK